MTPDGTAVPAAPRRPARARAVVVDYVRRAPGTFIWLAILAVTASVAHHLPADVLHRVLVAESTNIANLNSRPTVTLITSMLWFDGGRWWMYAVLYIAFHAPVEHWIGTRRWLVIVAVTQVGATYLSQFALANAIHHHWAPATLVHAVDYGVSYALAGAIGFITYRLPRRWRWPYAIVVVIGYSLPFLLSVSFTDIGHLTAALLGFACRPLVPGTKLLWKDAQRSHDRLAVAP